MKKPPHRENHHFAHKDGWYLEGSKLESYEQISKAPKPPRNYNIFKQLLIDLSSPKARAWWFSFVAIIGYNLTMFFLIDNIVVRFIPAYILISYFGVLEAQIKALRSAIHMGKFDDLHIVHIKDTTQITYMPLIHGRGLLQIPTQIASWNQRSHPQASKGNYVLLGQIEPMKYLCQRHPQIDLLATGNDKTQDAIFFGFRVPLPEEPGMYQTLSRQSLDILNRLSSPDASGEDILHIFFPLQMKLAYLFMLVWYMKPWQL